MRIRRRRDWFSIVATDLFCGVLAAVIIFDAVSPKESFSGGVPLLLTVRYDKPANHSCDSKNSVAIAFTVAGQRFSSVSGLPSIPGTNGSTCVLNYLFQTAKESPHIDDAKLLILEMNGTPRFASIQLLGGSPISFVCSPESSLCHIR
jgi:hypothetical protein